MAVRDLSAIFLDATDQPLPHAAGELAVAGVPVFPVAPGDKVPLIRNGRGFRDATTNLRQVEAWWRRFPQANIGVPTGAASGLVVVDVDVHGTNGYDALNRGDRAGLVTGWEFLVRSPTDGLHLYYPAAEHGEQRSWQIGDAGIDFRGDGGYIVAPPSPRMYALVAYARVQPCGLVVGRDGHRLTIVPMLGDVLVQRLGVGVEVNQAEGRELVEDCARLLPVS